MALSVKTLVITRPAAGTTNTVVTGLGFVPTVVIFLASNSLSSGWRAKLETAIGWAAKSPGDPTSPVMSAISQGSNDASASPSARLVTDTNDVRVIDGSSAAQAIAGTITFDSDGFTIDWTNSPYDAEQEKWPVLCLGGDARAVAASYTAQNGEISSDNFVIPHDVRFNPSAVLIGASSLNAQSFGVVAGAGSQWALALSDQLGANPTNQYRRLNNDRAVTILDTATGTVLMGARVNVMGPTGLSMQRIEANPWLLSATIGSGPGSTTSPVTFNIPAQVTVGPGDQVCVADMNNNRIMILTAAGAFINAITGLNKPQGVTVDPSGNIYTLDSGTGAKALRKYNPTLGLVWSVPITQSTPRHVCTDGTYLYCALSNGFSGQTIEKHRCSDGGLVASWGSAGTGDGQFAEVMGIATDGTYVYVTDISLNRVQKFTTTGAFIAKWGSSGSGTGQFSIPKGIGIDDRGTIWIADPGNSRLQEFSSGGDYQRSVTQIGGSGIDFGSGNILFVSNQTSHNLAKWDETSATITFAILYLAGLTANAGVSAKPITAAPAVQTIATGMNSKACLVAMNQEIALATTYDHMRFSLGLGSNNGGDNSVQGHAQDAVSTSNSDTRYTSGLIALKANNTTNTDEAFAAATYTTGNLVLTWSANDAIATQVAWMTFGNTTPLEAYFAAQAGFFPSKPGVPTPLSAMLEGVAAIPYAVIGNQGNIGTVTINAVSTMPGTGFGYAHVLASTIAAAGGFAPPGVAIPRDLASTIAAAGSLNIVKKLARDSTLQLLISAVSGMSGGLALPHNLGMSVAAAAEFLAGFHVDMPILRAAGPLDMPGTVNWHINPSAERGLTNWFTEGAGPAITQDSSESWDGTYSVKRITDATTAGQGIMARGIAGMNLSGLDDNGNRRRVFSQMRVKADSGSVGALMDIYSRVRYTDTTTVDGEHQQFALTNAFQYVTAPGFLLDPTKTLNFAEAVLVTPAAEAVTVYADGVQIEEARGNSPTMFTIGSYGRETGYWVGVPHVSMSVRDPIPTLIQAVGRGGDVVIDAHMYRATWDGIPVEDISETVISATVTMDAEREVTWAMDCVLTWEGWKRLTPNFDWIQPWMTVTWPDGTVKTGQLGHYFVVPSEATRNEFDATVKLSCFDPLWLLQRQSFTGPLTVLAGEERVKAVRAILDGGVLTGGDQPNTPSRYAVPGDGKPWKKKREWPAKTPRLQLLNDILQSAAFYPLWTTANGIITSRRMGDHRLAQRTPVKAYAANLPTGAVGGFDVSALGGGIGGPDRGPGGGGGGPLPIGGPDIWIPRLTSRLNSEIVGAIKTTPKALNMFDQILMINDDPDGNGIFVGGVVKGPNVDPGDEQRQHDHHRDRERRERHENRHDDHDSHEHNRADRDRDREGRDRQDDSAHRDRNRNRNRNQDTRQSDAERNRQHDDEERQRDRQRQREDARKDRERADQLAGGRVVFKGKNRTRIKPLYAPYVDDEATAQEIANALADELSATTQGVEISVLPDPSPNYCRETVVCNIWDAMSEPVAVGHFAVKSAKWGFTTSDCLQTLTLDAIDAGLVDVGPGT
jgi:hypothetical protein